MIEAHADDDRNYVRKAVNWALRNIGKRSLGLNRRAIASAKRIRARERARHAGSPPTRSASSRATPCRPACAASGRC